MDTKAPWQSKTLWMNLFVAAAPLFPGVNDYVSRHPDVVMALFSLMNVILRLVSSGKVGIT